MSVRNKRSVNYTDVFDSSFCLECGLEAVLFCLAFFCSFSSLIDISELSDGERVLGGDERTGFLCALTMFCRLPLSFGCPSNIPE